MSLRINLSDEEASSKAREYTVLPTGRFTCNITEIKEVAVKNAASQNFGKPYWNVKFVVDQGAPNDKYDGTAVYANIMLFEGAAYLITQLVKAIFPESVVGNTLDIPSAEAFLYKRVQLTGVKYPEGSDIKKGGKVTGKRERDQFEVKGFIALSEDSRPSSNTGLLS